MSVRTVTHDNTVKKITGDFGITLAAGKVYPAFSVVTSVDGLTWTDADVELTTAAAYNTQTVYVLTDEVDATAANAAGIGYTGEFNENNVTLPGVQTKAELDGVLQAKGISLKDWSK